MNNVNPAAASDDAQLSRAEHELQECRRILAEEENSCGDPPLTQGNSHRLSEAHFRLARSFETLEQLHRDIGNTLMADYPDS